MAGQGGQQESAWTAIFGDPYGRSTSASAAPQQSAWANLFNTVRPAETSQSAPASAQSNASGSVWGRLIESRTSRPQQTQRPRSSPSQSAQPGKVSEEYVVEGLVNRGLPRHIAQGFAMNFRDESGFDPGINEIAPLVQGSRGGYGLYQLTGPRRRQYEAMADQMGRDYSDPDLQLDFLMQELQTTEKRANSRIMETRTPGEAGAAIVRHFLRPAEEHRDRRIARYMDGGMSPAPRQRNRLWLDM